MGGLQPRMGGLSWPLSVSLSMHRRNQLDLWTRRWAKTALSKQDAAAAQSDATSHLILACAEDTIGIT